MIPYTLSIDNQTVLVEREEEIALVLELLGKDPKKSTQLQWDVLMKIPDEVLMSLIQTYRGLMACLQPLNEKTQFLFLLKIGDTLANVIGNSSHFANILSSITHEKERMRLIRKVQRKGLNRLVRSADDLATILEWTYGESQEAMLGLLGTERIRELIDSAEAFAQVFRFIIKTKQALLMEELGYEYIFAYCHNGKDLVHLLQSLSAEGSTELLHHLGHNRVLGIVRHDIGLKNILTHLPHSKEQTVINFLKNIT